jgi:hypothetical protein
MTRLPYSLASPPAKTEPAFNDPPEARVSLAAEVRGAAGVLPIRRSLALAETPLPIEGPLIAVMATSSKR